MNRETVYRTPLKKRMFPDYTRGEEIMNMVTHIVGGALGIAMLVLMIVKCAAEHNVIGVVSSCIYGASVIIMFTMSSVYHGLHKNMGKQVLRVIDHCDIFFTIAGTYTPILLVGIRPYHPVMAWTIFGVECALAILGAALNGIDLDKYSKFSMCCYLGMGWGIIFCLKATIEALTLAGFSYILGGGVAFTIGAVLYLLGHKRRYIHSIFHIFVIIGVVIQFIGIYLYAL